MFDRERADRAVNFFERVLTHTKGEYAGQPFLLQDWQERIIADLFGTLNEDGTRQYRTAYIEIPKKNGKLLDVETPIPTPSGWTPIGELRVGDLVFDHDGSPTPVVAVSGIEHPKTYRLRFSDGTEIVAGADHQWYTEPRVTGRKQGRRWRWSDRITTTEQIANTLVERDVRRGLTSWNHRIPLAGPLECPETELPIPPYTLGMWLGDGSRGQGVITKRNREDAEVITARIRREGVTVHAGKEGTWRIRGLAAKLRELGILTRKAIPQAYRRASLRQRLALAAGLMDSDGSCMRSGQCEFSTTTPALRDGMLELLRSLGLKPTLSTVPARYNGRCYGEAYRIHFFAYAGSGVFRLERKARRLKPLPPRPTRSQSRYIVGAEEVPTRPMRCIQVANPLGLFLAGEGMIPSHNSPLAAGIALYLLVLDDEIGAEIYSAGADRDQASIVYNYAKDMVLNSAALSERLQIVESRKRILDRRTRSFYAAVSADVPTKHGPNIHGLIFDELHAQPNRDLWDTLSTGTAARRQPLTVAITTAGYDRTSICWEQHEYARKVLEGIFEDPTFYAVIYAAAEEDDWLDEATWHKANPALGTFRKIEHMRSEAEKAKRVPAFQNTFRRLYLNQWTRQENRWLDLRAWDETAGEVVAERLGGVPCYAGLDLSSTVDLTALVLVFPQLDGFFDVLPFFWIPEENLVERARRDGVPYDAWARDGLIETTEGNVIDLRFIVEFVDRLREEEGYRIEEVAYDRWGATLVSQEMDDRGFTVVPFGQGFAAMSPPTKELLNLVLQKRLRHGGNPVLRWMADNLVVRTDPAGNIKPDKAKSKEKIDGMVALIMGLDRATRHGAVQPERYVNEETPRPPVAGIRSMVF